MNTLRGLYRGLEALYGADSGVDPVDFLVPFAAAPGAGQELLLLREDEDGAVEIGLCLDDATLARLEARPLPQVLVDAALPDALPVIEGLSHLLYVVEAARRSRPVSGLELETQAEVDKLALCLLARWRRPAAFSGLVDRLFGQFTLLPGMSGELRERYETANRIALAFVRTLERFVRRGQWSRLRRALREFWAGGMDDKLRLAA